ncbi:LacI family transcriptional regulator [Secundilactobacillus pentosiphilus]|uniref:LacI family transcriptional regulator n=1 Tax=Secundilactobacillus pentosiphilus TaxID=1714682 RepID=A0A1Z5IL44_9LACO|nr:LacI family DNA-binding transcriptional regulator [Secundilactobacillus pentosiphilus]GAX02484.1 LacI family transcriptional regulator [Secundilactobacillus pentosiphilus]
MTRKRKPASLSDIAAASGYSIATVSRAINHHGSVSALAQRTIDALVAELDYHTTNTPQPAKSTTIAVLIPNLSNPFNSSVLEGIQNAATAHGLNVALLMVKETDTDIDYYLNMLKDANYCGVIALGALPDNQTAYQLNHEIPVVMCSEYLEDTDMSYVGIDDNVAAQKATDYLTKIGRRHIALINATTNHKYARERETGYKQALQRALLSLDADLILHINSIRYNLALSKVTDLLRSRSEIDAIFAASDIFAIAALEAARHLGRQVPDELSVVGFDNTFLATVVSPKLTTIKQPAYEIGHEACEILQEKIARKNAPERHEVLKASLLVREST